MLTASDFSVAIPILAAMFWITISIHLAIQSLMISKPYNLLTSLISGSIFKNPEGGHPPFINRYGPKFLRTTL
jgi:hypothetical protein